MKLQMLAENDIDERPALVAAQHSASVAAKSGLADSTLGRADFRILFISGDAPFFITHFFELARALLRDGKGVELATPVDAGSGRGDLEAVRRIEAAGIIVHRIGLKRASVNPLNEILLIQELSKLISESKPSLIHCLGAKPILYAGAIARLRGVPAIHSVIGLGLPFMRTGLIAAMRRALILQGFGFAFGNGKSRITVEHEADRATIAGVVGNRPVVRTFGVGVDLSAFQPRAEGIHNTPPVVMLGARLIETKGVRSFVEVARRLKARNISARFVLQCQLDLHNRYAIQAEEVEAWHREGVIEWWGPTTDMAEALKKADIFCLPTFYREGTPKALLEAAATGLPIVTTNIAGCKDVVLNNQNGLLVEPKNEDQLEAALSKLITDHEFRIAAGHASRAMAIEKFSVRTFIQNTFDLYDAVLPDYQAELAPLVAG